MRLFALLFFVLLSSNLLLAQEEDSALPEMGPAHPRDELREEDPKEDNDLPNDKSKTQKPLVSSEPVYIDKDPSIADSYATPSHQFAIGLNLAWTTRQDYGSRTFRRLTPEVIGFTYGALPWEEYWWRIGARIGYSNAQPEMPQAVRIEETDTTTLIEIAITRDWHLVPSFAFGGGYDFRRIKLKTAPPITTVDERLNRKETLWMWYVQAGAGLPLLKGMILIEPTIRYHTIQYDSRSHWLFGIETTVGI